MKSNKKRLILTIIDIAVVIIAGLWVLWLCIYFTQTIDGGILITSKANIFERNYLVPAQIFGITITLTVTTVILYHRLRIKELIGKKYIILALFNTLPFWLLCIEQIKSMIVYWEWIY